MSSALAVVSSNATLLIGVLLLGIALGAVVAIVAHGWRPRGPAQEATGDLSAAKGRIDAQLGHVRRELDRVVEVVSQLERGRERAYGALSTQIAEASQRTAELADTTRSLREALSSTKARGQWGERMAADVLELAGFVEGVNYVRQRSLESGGTPDYAFLLPQGRQVRMDVKFPLDNYLRHLRAENDAQGDQLRRAFLRDVRARVTELGRRGYDDDEESVDCVLLFIPNEQLFAFIAQHDPELFDRALGQRVVCCSPLTLFAVLAVIRQAVDSFLLARTSDEILGLLGGFSDQWERFTVQMDTLGTHLDRAQRAYEGLSTTRRRQLERQLDQLELVRQERGLDAVPTPATDRAGAEARQGPRRANATMHSHEG